MLRDDATEELFMTSGRAEASGGTNRGTHWPTAASLAMGTSFFALWFWFTSLESRFLLFNGGDCRIGAGVVDEH